MGDRKTGDALAFHQFVTQGSNRAQCPVHALDGVRAQGRVAGMPGGAVHLQCFHENTLVLANGHQIGGLADHAVAARAPTVSSSSELVAPKIAS